MNDWTVGPSGASNTSEQFEFYCKEVEQLIRGDAHKFIAGRADLTARLIMGILAHHHNLEPHQFSCCDDHTSRCQLDRPACCPYCPATPLEDVEPI